MFFTAGALAAGRVVITDRLGGVSGAPYDALNLGDHVGDDPPAVEEKRGRVAAAVGVPRTRLALMRQVHGASVAHVDAAPGRGSVPEADGLVTTTRGLALTVLVADCTPVLLAAADPDVIAVAHAGRRGVQVDVVTATVAAMQRAGARAASIQGWVGPAICGRCYEVSPEVQAQVCATAPQARSTTRAGRPSLDIRRAVVAQLAAAGVSAVEVDPGCTAERADLYSYRRDGVTGRFAGVVWLPERPADG
ncbi:MAG: peptidoglycan editing factor PgeF [Actinomycetes bacterium]